MDVDAPDDALLMRQRTRDGRLSRGRRFALRRATAALRRRPDFLVIGAMKSGTSTLFHHIAAHPLVDAPLRKELHYFGHARRAGLGEGWYRAHFPLGPARGRLTGEATPDYLFDPDVPARIAAELPAVRLVAILREPAARAVSQYRHEVRMGRETLPIEAAFAAEEVRMAHAARLGEAGRETLHHASYRRRGLYAEQITRYRALFPPDRLLVLGAGALAREPEATLGRAFEFLGLPPEPVDGGVARNRAAGPAGAPVALLAELRDWFAAPNARLAEMLGGLPDW